MPCNSDYLNPTEVEQERRLAAALLIHVLECLDETVSPKLRKAADDIYADGQDNIPALCARLKRLSEESPSAFERIVYNAKSRESRDLANWWEEHLEADRKRLEAERDAANRRAVKQSAMGKLTKAERDALGI